MNKDFKFEKISFNAGLLVKEMLKRKIKVKLIEDTEIIQAQFKKHKELLYDIHSSLLSYPLGWIVNDKYYTKKYLQKNKITVADGEFFGINEKNLTLKYSKKIGFPIVLKPTIGSHGDNVWTDIKTIKELDEKIEIFKNKKNHNGYFIVEKQVKGNEHRIFVTKKGFIAVVKRIPANVIGDGVNNILALIKKENFKRMNPRINCLCEIRLDEITFDYMEKNDLILDFIPKKGEKVFVRANSNVSTGGNCFDVTDKVHVSVKKLADKILKIFPDLPYIGFDLICDDITKKLKKDSYIVCELNSAPGLSLHMMPEKGQPRNVAGALIDLLFPETKYE